MKNSLLLSCFISLSFVLQNTGNSQTFLDEWDPADDTFVGATALNDATNEIQTHGPHQLSPEDEADWFKISLEAGTMYKFESTGDANTVGTLYQTSEEIRVAQNSGYFENQNFQIIFTPEISGDYYLKVELIVPEVLPGPDEIPEEFLQGEYTLNYQSGTFEVTPRDEWDPNDDIPERATVLNDPLEINQSHGPHTLSNYDQEDWFLLFLKAEHSYNFNTEGDATIIGLIYASDGQTVVLDYDAIPADGRFSVDFTPQQDAVYLLKLSQLSTGTNSYTLNYQLISTPPEPIEDEWDPMDDHFNGATTLNTPTLNDQSHGPHSLSHNDQLDWFSFSLTSDRDYEFRSSGSMDTYATIYDSAGLPLTEQDDGGTADNFLITFTPPETATYYLQVRGFNLGATGNYFLHYREIIELTQADQWDPIDDTSPGATQINTISTKEQSHGPHSLSETDVYDWFRISLDANAEYEFTTLGNTDTVGTLFTNDAITILETHDDTDNNRNFRLRFSVEQSGNHYLRIHSNNNDGGTYTLVYRSNQDPIEDDDQLLHQFPLQSEDEFTEQPGGFDNYPKGNIDVGGLADDSQSDDGIGATITCNPGQVAMLIFDAVETQSNPVLVQAKIRANNPQAAVTLVALGDETGSIASDDVKNTEYFMDQYKKLVLVYDSPTDQIIPIFQLSNLNGDQAVSVYLDEITIYSLPNDQSTSAAMISRENSSAQANDNLIIHPSFEANFNASNEIIRIPGGFNNVDPGFFFIGPYQANIFGELTASDSAYTDSQGITLTLEPNTLELLMMPSIEVDQGPVLTTLSVKSNAPGAVITFGLLDGSNDGSIATLSPSNSSVYMEKMNKMSIIYDSFSNNVIPVFQVSNLGGSETVTIYIDNLRIYNINENQSVANDLIFDY